MTTIDTNRRRLARPIIVAGCALVALAAGMATAQEGFAVRQYNLAHYDFKTDVPEELADEACVRIEQMFAEFQRRSPRIKIKIKEPQPFWLFNNPNDYARAGGPYGTAAVYTEEAGVVALAAAGNLDTTWTRMQEMAFAQYAHRVIGYWMPLWVKTGFQGYFGLSQWTGDRFVVGFATPSKVSGIQALIESDELIPFDHLTRMEFPAWQQMMMTPGKIDVVQLQCWSMVHFLIHAEDGKYVPGLDKHLLDVNAIRKDRIEAFNKFVRTLQPAYEEWWMAQTAEPTLATLNPDYETVARTMTTFFARASARGQTFDTVEEFLADAKNHDLDMPPHGQPDWLPWSLIDRQLRRLADLDQLAQTQDHAEPAVWSIDNNSRPPSLILTRADNTTFTGQFKLARDKTIKSITLTVTQPKE